jgi:hypothetical protein
MEIDTTQRIKHIMNWGVLSGVALIATNMLTTLLPGNNIFQLVGWLGLGAGIYLGVQKLRDNVYEGYIDFSEAAFSALQIAFFAAVLLGFFMYVYLGFIDKTAIDKMLVVQEQLLLKKDVPTADIKNNMRVMAHLFTPAVLALMAILVFTFIGGVMGLLVAALVKRESNSFDDFVGK